MLPISDIEAILTDAESATVAFKDGLTHIKPIWDWILSGADLFQSKARVAPTTATDLVAKVRSMVDAEKANPQASPHLGGIWEQLLLQLIQVVLGKLVPTPKPV